ncbi:MAG: thioesterase family protein [Bacteroidia bacterium]
MKNPFLPGDEKVFVTQVSADKLASFGDDPVHPVYSTFALARDAEWACRLFVLDMKEEGEEGIGTYLSVEHRAPARAGTAVRIVARLESVEGSTVHCSYRAYDGERLLAQGQQTQRIIDRHRFATYLDTLPTP